MDFYKIFGFILIVLPIFAILILVLLGLIKETGQKCWLMTLNGILLLMTVQQIGFYLISH